MKKVAIILSLFFATMAFAQNEEADAAFCKYTMEQGMAQRDLYRTPFAIVGPIQPNTGTPPQFVVGLTNSLRDDKKAGLTMQVAKKTCALYAVTSDAQLHLMYALPQIEKDVLNNRLRLIDEATAKLDAFIADNMKLVTSQNLTMPSVYMLASAKVRLDETRTTALTGIASPYVPKLTDVPLRVLIADKLQREDTTQTAINKLDKQQTWDVQLSAGARRRLPSNTPSNGMDSWGGYGAFSLSYNLGHHAISNHYDKSVDAYNEWKRTQFDDVTTQAKLLKKQMEDTITVQESQLKAMQTHDAEIEAQLKKLEGVDTNNAIGFRNQLLADQVMLRVDIQDAQFRVTRLQQYLADNF